MSSVKVYNVKIEPISPDFITTCRYYMGSCYYNCARNVHCVYTAFKLTIEGEVEAEIPPETDTEIQLRIWCDHGSYPWHYFYKCSEGSCTPNWDEISEIIRLGRVNTYGEKETKIVRKSFEYSFTLFTCDYENAWRINNTWELIIHFDLFDYMWHYDSKVITVTFHFEKASRKLIEERYIDNYYKLYYVDIPIEAAPLDKPTSPPSIPSVDCSKRTTHFNSVLEMLTLYDRNGDGIIDLNDYNRAKNDYFKGLLTKEEMNYFDICYTYYNGNISKMCKTSIPSRKITLTADKSRIREGGTVNFTANVYGPPSTSVKTCVYVEGRRGDCYWVSLDSNGHGVFKFSATFPSYGTYHVKVCVVNPLTNEPIYCSNEATVTVEKVGKPKLEITINVDKTKVNIGDKVKVYGEVKNIGDGTFSGGILHIYANDKEVTHIPVISLPPNHSQSFSCNIVLWEAGDYSIKACVEVGGMKVCSNPVTVRVGEPKVTISDPVAEKTSVEVGETVRISWKVRNESLAKVSVTVQSYVNDKPYKGEVIYLDPKEEKEFAITIEFGEAGDYKVYACVEEVKVL